MPDRPRKPDRFAYSDLLNALPDAILLVDDAGLITELNDQARMLFGYERSEIVGQPVELLLPERKRAAHVEDRARYARSPHVRPMGGTLGLVARHKDGHEFPVEINLAPYHAPDGPHVVASIRTVPEGRGSSK